METVDNATRRAVVDIAETPPDDVLPARCPDYGESDDGRFMVCARAKGHTGDHWDDTDRRYWRFGSGVPSGEPEAVPA